MAKIRELLAVPASLRAMPEKTRRVARPVEDTGWAEERAKELALMGVTAKVVRPRSKKEPPVVVYRLA